jgi:hypothetical protein
MVPAMDVPMTSKPMDIKPVEKSLFFNDPKTTKAPHQVPPP